MRADRLLSIMLILQDQGRLTTARLAATLEVSRRTVLRDLNALTTAGVPVYSESGPGGGVYLDEKYRVSLTGLREVELRSLFIANLAGPLNDIGLRQLAESGSLKLLAALSPSQRSEVERVRQRLFIDPSAWSSHSQPLSLLTELLDAVFEDRRMRVVYRRDRKGLVERVLEPYSLVCKANVWYLLAAQAGGEIHNYRVSRIEQIELLQERFERSADFDLTAFWAEQLELFRAYMPAFDCTIEINSARLDVLTWPFVSEYRLKEKANREGWQILELKLDSIGSAEMLIFNLGLDARILEPAKLVEAMRQKAAALNRLYNSQPPGRLKTLKS